MISVTVTRGAGDKALPDIVDGLLSGSEAAMRARANAELDNSAPDARLADIEIAPQDGIVPGMIVLVRESGQPERHALVRRVQIDLRRSDVAGTLERKMVLTVEYRV